MTKRIVAAFMVAAFTFGTAGVASAKTTRCHHHPQAQITVCNPLRSI